jgi:hypothetical protein
VSRVLSIACEKTLFSDDEWREQEFSWKPKKYVLVDIYEITLYSFSLQPLGTREWSRP